MQVTRQKLITQTLLTLAVKPLIIRLDSSAKREDYIKNQKDQVGEVIQSS